MKLSRICLTILFLCFFGYQNIFAGGLDNSAIGSKGYAMSKAFTGVADDSSAIYYNPGGQGFLEDGLYAQVVGSLVFTDFTYETQEKKDTCVGSRLAPGFFVTYKIDKMALGLGFYLPFSGGGVNYENFQNSNSDIEHSVGLYAVTPSFAYQLSPEIAFGLGLSVYFGYVTTLFDIEMMGFPVNVSSEYSDLAGIGGNIGVLVKPIDSLSVGVTLQSPVSVSMDGSIKASVPFFGSVNYDSKLEALLPLYLILGFSYQLSPNFILAVSFDFQFWSMMDEITITTETDDETEESKEETHFKDSINFNLGFEYKLEGGLIIRGGFTYSQSPTKDEGLDFASNDVSYLSIIIGAAYGLTPNIEVNLSFNYGLGFEREYESQKFNKDFIVIHTGIRIKFGNQR